ncbi:CIC11C00000001129 [Sungouiella intermedia]|uniref:Cap-associated protein CAF20 n=1 Tax=Sungouiella intermedia TaxID=45354 RepID=A0A1L0D3E7_9ASCO|nr:CIC11C00000001129 [[Candida] intermedia]SGZ50480.1 CIC11C00000004067 [[Candida] intermedia]
MAKYTEEQLFEAQEQAYNPKPDVLEAFNQLVESVREHVANEKRREKSNGDTYIDEHGNERSYHHLNRRRLSRSGNKPNLRKKAVETTVDEDGWATMAKPKKSFGAEEALDERAKFRESIKETTVKVRPNNKNLGSSKAVDPRDAIADKQTNTFNAFEALGDDDDDSE